jgi:hypothetical protein
MKTFTEFLQEAVVKKLTPAQNATIKREHKRVCDKIDIGPHDQFYTRLVNQREEEGAIFFDVEVKIINPDDDYNSGWYWVDAIGVGPKGKAIG